MSDADSFPQFGRLPLELRRLVWLHCLPRRIAEEDVPFTLLDGNRCRQACWPAKTTHQNARVPLIASVCREARNTVVEWGHHQESQDDTSLESIWLQPKVDTALHLNWTRRMNDAYYWVNNSYTPSFNETTLAMLIYRARWEYGLPISLVADILYPFDVAELIPEIPAGDHELPSSEFDFPASGLPEIFLLDGNHERELDISDITAMVDGQTLYVTMVAISLHVDKTTALESGIFGLLGDATVQTVDFDDLNRLHRLYELYNMDATLKHAEPHVQRLFCLIFSPEFRNAVFSWQSKARWLLQVAVWKQIQKSQPESFGGADHGLVWEPPVQPGQAYIRMAETMPNQGHSWWTQHAEEQILKIKPHVMIRLCENHCYKEERRGSEFGDAWFRRDT